MATIETRAVEEAEVHVQRFTVSYRYPVVFTRHALDVGNGALASAITERAERCRVVVVADAGVVEHWPDLGADVAGYARAHDDVLSLLAPVRVLPGGEAAKNDPMLVIELQRFFFELGLDRHAYVLAIGGGALLDLAGYAAATTHRGVRLVRMPTTVLSQNDAGIGVKNGINAFGQKNGIGTFEPPHAVVNDAAFLSTLALRDRRAGMAEAVKVALVRDASFFAWLCDSRAALARCATPELEHLVRRCAILHLSHIAAAGDPFERGNARPLDYGHWAAHKLELLSEHELRHGEAVAIGMALDTRYAVEAGLLDETAGDRVIELLRDLGLPLWHAAMDLVDERGKRRMVLGLDEFRQHLGGELRIPMLREIGRVTEVAHIEEDALARALSWLRQRA